MIQAVPYKLLVPGPVQTEVSALWQEAPQSRAVLVFAHGAGAGMNHEFMADMSRILAAQGLATLRFQFPYMERGSRRIDGEALLLATLRAAWEKGAELAQGRPVFAVGKSMGGRMSSRAVAKMFQPDLETGTDTGTGADAAISTCLSGIVFIGFPLHPAKKRATTRGDHLDHVPLPLLFLQGTRDALAAVDLMENLLQRLKSRGQRADMVLIQDADHGFAVLKKSGKTNDQIRWQLGVETKNFIERICESGSATV